MYNAEISSLVFYIFFKELMKLRKLLKYPDGFWKADNTNLHGKITPRFLEFFTQFSI